MTTYTLTEIKYLLRKLGTEEIQLLEQVIEDEASFYTERENEVITKMMKLRTDFLNQQEARVLKYLS